MIFLLFYLTLQVQRPSLTRPLVEGLVLRGRQVPTQNHAFFSKACKSSPRPRSSHIGPAKTRHQSHQKSSKTVGRTGKNQLSKEHLSFECVSSQFWTCQQRVFSELHPESDGFDVAFIMFSFRISQVPSKIRCKIKWDLASTWQLWSGISPRNVH